MYGADTGFGRLMDKIRQTSRSYVEQKDGGIKSNWSNIISVF